MLKERDIFDMDTLNQQGNVSVNTIKKLPTYHAIILARNETGRVNLYKLVSQSHLKYYRRRPRVPKSLFLEHREGLLIGRIVSGTSSKCTGTGNCQTGQFL